MGRIDHVLRAVAVLAAVTAVVVAILKPQFPLNIEAAVRTGGQTDLRREAAAARTNGYAYLLRSPEHRFPARWCPGEIGYWVDTSQLAGSALDPSEELARWQSVFADWTVASRGQYTFTYWGERELRARDDGQLDVESIEPGTIGITYMHGDAGVPPGGYQASAVRGRTAGNGGLQVTNSTAGQAGELVGDRGFVMIDVVDAADLSGDGLRRTLYQHESGHALGLGHVDDPHSLMNATLSTDRTAIGPGDRAGLLSLLNMPCER